MRSAETSDAPGLYVHVPFCRHRCHFCAFAVTTHLDFADRYVTAVAREAALAAPVWPGRFDTVYLGGGTPSLLTRPTLATLLGGLRAAFAVTPDAEVTLEANPDDLSPADFDALRALGVTRLSLGVQALDDGDLRRLTRTHTAAQGRAAVAAARAAGFASLTVDVLYGLPWRTPEEDRAAVRAVADLGADHVSAYLLSFEEGTPFRVFRDRGRMAGLADDEEADRFLAARETLEGAGYEPYEVSNYARSPAHRSRHNRKYWEGAPYLGLGPAAHSYDGVRRWWNAAAARSYCLALEAGRSPVAGEETLTQEDRRLERLFLGLRTELGLPLSEFASAPALPALRREGLVAEDPSRLRLTPAGLAVADQIAMTLHRCQVRF